MRRSLSAFAVAVLLGASVAHADDATYDIKIQRPMAARQKYGLTATNTLRSAERVEVPNGDSNRTSLFRRVIVEADVTVDKVDDAGAESMASVVIRKLTLQSSDGAGNMPSTARAVLDPGTELAVVYQANGQPVFATRKGVALSDEAMLALQQGFERMAMTDAVYGTAEKKKLNDTWPINSQALGGDKSNPQYVDPSKVTGSVKLAGVRALAGLQCLQLEASTTTKDFQVQGGEAKDASMTRVFSASVPVDLHKPVVSWSVRSTTHFVMESKPLGQGTLRRTVDTEVQHEAARTLK